MLLLLICTFVSFFSLIHAQNANIVYGQGGSFTTNTQNTGGVSAGSLSSPSGLVFDSAGNLYAADAGNSRVLYYPRGATIATRVYGQLGSFITNLANNGGINANTLYGVSDVAVDSGNNVYIADTQNNRVLYYAAGSTTASRVYGQGNSFTSNTRNLGGLASADTLYFPGCVYVDASGNLYICDGGNNRVLFYPVGSNTATRVYGQGGSFTSTTFSPITASSLFLPIDVITDSNNNLYIVDGGNSRVLYYPAGSTTATRVYGQGGSFTTGSFSNPGGVSANTLSRPRGIVRDAGNNIYVADSDNYRVLYYFSGTTNAVVSWGQGGTLTSNQQNNNGINAASLNVPARPVLDSQSNLYVSDSLNNRILAYPNFQTTLTTAPTTSPGTGGTTCFHESTIITYDQVDYLLGELAIGVNPKCVIPHVVVSSGFVIRSHCSTLPKNSQTKTLRLTDEHLVYSRRVNPATNFPSANFLENAVRLTAASSLKSGDVIFADLQEQIPCVIEKIWTETEQKYFGLNCLDSVVLANGIKTSTFGNYHMVPATWMSWFGHYFGIKAASVYGDKLATWAAKLKLL